jgi:hypothetical protein
MTDLKINNGEVTLCCGRKPKCPRLRVDEDKVLITDDDNNTVVLDTAQALLIHEAITLLKEDG